MPQYLGSIITSQNERDKIAAADLRFHALNRMLRKRYIRA
jgi:hypothetical protein